MKDAKNLPQPLVDPLYSSSVNYTNWAETEASNQARHCSKSKSGLMFFWGTPRTADNLKKGTTLIATHGSPKQSETEGGGSLASQHHLRGPQFLLSSNVSSFSKTKT